MKSYLFSLTFIILSITIISAQNQYNDLVKLADSLYNAKDYRNSAFKFSEAFKANGWKGGSNDRYNAACSWALANVPDSAFFQLNRIATKANYTNLNHITHDSDLNSLHNDERWKPLIEIIKENKEKEEINLDKALVAILDTVNINDQQYRQQLDDVEAKYGRDSKEIRDLWQIINKMDSINLVAVSEIIDKHGWLGPDVIGRSGSSTLFLVIQHSDLPVQEKYLPLFREAVKNKKANPGNLALMEDRLALRQGKRQIYGSQVTRDLEKDNYYVAPLEDAENVDKRRAEVGLPPLAEYVSRWNIVWDPIQYNKDLPAIEAKEKK